MTVKHIRMANGDPCGCEECSPNRYVFVPDRGDACPFRAPNDKEAQQYAARHWHGVPGIIRRLEPLLGAPERCKCGYTIDEHRDYDNACPTCDDDAALYRAERSEP